jgi:hypothetical protein
MLEPLARLLADGQGEADRESRSDGDRDTEPR